MKIKLSLSIVLAAFTSLAATITSVNTGTGPNSGNGDTARTAFNKINTNINALNAQLAVVVDDDAVAYLVATGKTNSPLAKRVNSAFVELKKTGLWTSLIDGAVVGTNMNLSGSTWATLKLRYGTNSGSPVVSSDGITFDGTQRALIRSLPDMRTNTVIVCIDNSATPTASTPIIALQNSSSIDCTAAIISHPSLANMSLFRNSSSQLVSNQLPYWSGEGFLARMPDEHYVSIGFDGTGRFSTVDSYATGAVSSVGWTMASTMTSANIAALLTSDAANPTTGLWKGRLKSFLIFNRVLNTNEIRQAQTVLRWLDPREDNYVFVGDSLTTSYADGFNNEGPTQNWPYQFMQTGANANKFWFRNFASGSTHMQQWAAWYNDRCAIGMPGGPVRNSTLMYWLGANDLMLGNNLTTSLSLAGGFWGNAKSNGFRVEVFTSPLITGYAGHLTASEEANRQILNNALVTNLVVNRVWKVHELFPDMTPGNQWTPDGCHHKLAADQRIAAWLLSDGSVMPSLSRVDLPAISGDGALVSNVWSRLDKNLSVPTTYAVDWTIADTLLYQPSGSSITFTSKNLSLLGNRAQSRDLIIKSPSGTTSVSFPAWSWVGPSGVLNSIGNGQLVQVRLKVVPSGATPTDADVIAETVSGADVAFAFDTNATNYLSANTFANSTATMRNAVDAFVKTLKANSCWSLHDGLWPMLGTNATQTGLNLIGGSYALSSSSATFTASGITYSGLPGSFSDTQFNPTTASSPNYVLNSAHFLVSVQALGYSSNSFNRPYPGTRIGFSDAANNSSIWAIDASFGGQLTGQGPNAGTPLPIADGGDDRGVMAISRTASNVRAFYLRAVTPTTGSDASSAVPNGNFYLGAENNGGAFGNAAYTLDGASIGGGISSAQYAIIRDAWNTLNTALGR